MTGVERDVESLAAFLRARLDEREQIARAALRDEADDGVWSVRGNHEMDACYVEGKGITIYDEGGHTAEQANHIASNDPKWALVDTEAKRQIIELWESVNVPGWDDTARELEKVLRLLALPYGDHPSYDEAWRPA